MCVQAVEFGDTVFIVLRKRPVIILHWYHHTTVLVFCWHSYRELTSMARWFVAVNYAVHSCMYTYYAVRAAGVTRAHTRTHTPMCTQDCSVYPVPYRYSSRLCKSVK